ncbi:mitochondrial translation release factor in rescue [Aphidius gifuensis]|uniref:mitochondrial translation release factor in rescue n=1 Tax=Aphidius gifuensis TaxID=684658 RepID=UPI001CDBCB32|nr:mitochondrial translation release factor in rescue [Aphidius gifuensis]
MFSRCQCYMQIRYKSIKKLIDYSKVPKLNEADLEEQFVRGSGPGGQATNRTYNAVVLKHKPTGIVVKCHQQRSVTQNQKIAREILITKLDNELNKEHSIEQQEKLLKSKQSNEQTKKRNKMLELKKAFLKRENLE